MTTMTQAEIAKMKPAEFAAYMASLTANVGKLTPKVGKSGALSLYGMGRFPVTLYREQWVRLLDNHQIVRDFIAAHTDAQWNALQAQAIAKAEEKDKSGKTN